MRILHLLIFHLYFHFVYQSPIVNTVQKPLLIGTHTHQYTETKPCKTEDGKEKQDCTMHVFRVVLSNKPNESNGKIINKELKEILKSQVPSGLPPHIQGNVTASINSGNFLLKETNSNVDNLYLKEEEEAKSSQIIISPSNFSFLSPMIILFLCLGIILGIIITICCVCLMEYRSRPQIDRSSMLSFRRMCGNSTRRDRVILRDAERLINKDMYSQHHTPSPLVTRSLSYSNNSSNGNYVNAFSLIENHELAMASAPPPPMPRREGRYIRRIPRGGLSNSIEMKDIEDNRRRRCSNDS